MRTIKGPELLKSSVEMLSKTLASNCSLNVYRIDVKLRTAVATMQPILVSQYLIAEAPRSRTCKSGAKSVPSLVRATCTTFQTQSLSKNKHIFYENTHIGQRYFIRRVRNNILYPSQLPARARAERRASATTTERDPVFLLLDHHPRARGFRVFFFTMQIKRDQFFQCTYMTCRLTDTSFFFIAREHLTCLHSPFHCLFSLFSLRIGPVRGALHYPAFSS